MLQFVVDAMSAVFTRREFNPKSVLDGEGAVIVCYHEMIPIPVLLRWFRTEMLFRFIGNDSCILQQRKNTYTCSAPVPPNAHVEHLSTLQCAHCTFVHDPENWLSRFCLRYNIYSSLYELLAAHGSIDHETEIGGECMCLCVWRARCNTLSLWMCLCINKIDIFFSFCLFISKQTNSAVSRRYSL